MSTPDYSFVLSRRYPGAQWALNNNDYEQLDWFSDNPKPSQSELDAAWPEVEAEITAERNAKIAARQAALAKLADLGLTKAEISALVA